MMVKIYVLFESLDTRDDHCHDLFRLETPLAVVTKKPGTRHDYIDYVETNLYQSHQHLNVEKDIRNLGASKRNTLGLTEAKVHERLIAAFGNAAVNGKGLIGQTAYVVMGNKDRFFPRSPVHAFLDKDSSYTATPVAVYASIYDFRPELRTQEIQRANKQKEDAKSNLDAGTRRIFGLD
jgi:hypothetical protein